MSDSKPEEINLAKEKFDKININLNKSESIEFKDYYWIPKISNKSELSRITEQKSEEENGDEGNNDNKEEEQRQIRKLQEEMKNQDEKIEDLNEKIKEIDEKIEIMKRILNIDVSEQEYVKYLSNQKNNEDK